jgi:hypothetical protein
MMESYRKWLRRCAWAALILFLPAISAYATAIPRLRLEELVSASDVIIIGQVDSPQFSHLVTAQLSHEMVQMQVFTEKVTVLRVLKGEMGGVTVVKFEIPADRASGYRAIATGIRILFLRHSGESLMPTNPYYPSLPGSTAESGSLGSSPLESVIGVLAAVLGSEAEPSLVKQQVLDIAYAIPPNGSFTESLRRGLDTSDLELKYRVMGNLIRRGDTNILPAAVEVLLKADFPERYRVMIEYAIRTSVNEAAAVPILNRLAHSQYASTRSAVLEAFWHIRTWSVVPSAAAALTDPDQDTRYYAVRALAAATGEASWGPSIPEFRDHESKYIQHWTDWAKAHSYTE